MTKFYIYSNIPAVRELFLNPNLLRSMIVYDDLNAIYTFLPVQFMYSYAHIKIYAISVSMLNRVFWKKKSANVSKYVYFGCTFYIHTKIYIFIYAYKQRAVWPWL